MNKWTGELWQRTVADALALPRGDEFFLAWRDTVTGLEYIRRSNDIVNSGLSMDLRGYQYAVLLHWRELRSTAEQPWEQLCNGLNGAGVHNLDEALTHLRLRPLTAALRHAISHEGVRTVAPRGEHSLSETQATRAWAERVQPVFTHWLALENPATTLTPQQYSGIAAALADTAVKAVSIAKAANALPPSMAFEVHPEALWTPLLTVAALRALPSQTDVVDTLALRKSLAEIFSEVGIKGEDAWRAAARVRLALLNPKLDNAEFWSNGDVLWLASVNEHDGVRYINHEALQQLLQWLTLTAAMQPAGSAAKPLPSEQILAAAKAAGYRYDDLVAALLPAETKPVASPAKAVATGTKPVPVAAPAKKAARKEAAKKSPAKKSAAKKASPKKLNANATTVQPKTILEPHAADGHLTADTASIPDQSPAGKAAAKKGSARKTPGKKSPPKL